MSYRIQIVEHTITTLSMTLAKLAAPRSRHKILEVVIQVTVKYLDVVHLQACVQRLFPLYEVMGSPYRGDLTPKTLFPQLWIHPSSHHRVVHASD